MSGLAKKYYEKKAKRSSSLSVGDTPSLTPGSLESASLTIWTTHLTTLESRAAEHEKLGQDLVNSVGWQLEQAQKKLEELRKSHAEYQTKLVKERDTTYGDLKKLKSKYDTVCQEVENKRKKTESSFDSSRGKAQSSYNQQLMEMHNVKNTYLIGINVSNKLKECYYHQYVPELLDSLQDLSETRVSKLNSIWTLASALETATLTRSTEHMKHLSAEIPRNEPRLDSIMFVRHNAVQWLEPAEMVFEPSPVWLDSDAMAVDDTAKIFLRNILSKSKPVGKQLQSEIATKQRELENVKRVREAIRTGKDKRDETDCVRSLFAVMEDMHAIERRRITAEVETSTITTVAGDLSLRGKNHSFKSETFKIPTNCDLCADRIWGLSAKGFVCTDCGFTCHSKCELKVPADCPGEQTKEEKKQLKVRRQAAASAAVEAPPPVANGDSPMLSRQDTMNSLSSGYAANAHRSVSGAIPRSSTLSSSHTTDAAELPADSPTLKPPPASTSAAGRKRIVAPPPVAYVSGGGPPAELDANGSDSPAGGTQRKAKMLYAYDAREAGEISVKEGRTITILDPDGKFPSPTPIPFRPQPSSLPTAHLTNGPGLPHRRRLDQNSHRPRRRRSRANSLRGRPAGQRRPLRPPRLAALQPLLLHHHRHPRRSGQEERTGSRAAARRQEGALRRGAVRVRGAVGDGVRHGGGGTVYPGQSRHGGRVVRGRAGWGGQECAGELCGGCWLSLTRR